MDFVPSSSGPNEQSQAKPRQDKSNQGELEMLINPKTDNFLLDNLRSILGSDEINIILIDGAEYTMSSVEFFNAVQIITCDEFSDYIDLKLLAEDYEERLHKAFKIAHDAPTTTNIYDVVYYAKYQGRRTTEYEAIRDRIIETMGYDAWCDACKLYESFYHIPYYEV